MANAATPIMQVTPFQLARENGPPWWRDFTPVGKMGGLPMRKLATEFYDVLVTIPADATVGTGISVHLFVTDDGADAADLGKVVKFGIAAKKIASDTDTLDLTSAGGAEQTTTVTLNAAAGVVEIGTVTIANAALDSAGAGDLVALRVRRIGTDATDTCQGRVVLCGAYVWNTAT